MSDERDPENNESESEEKIAEVKDEPSGQDKEPLEKLPEKPAIDEDDDEILDALKSRETETKGDEKALDSPEMVTRESTEKPANEADDHEILDALKLQAPESKPGENAPEDLELKASLEKLADEADDDEILDEIKFNATETKQADPEQYKKDFNRNQVEAVLFVSGQAVSAEEISVKLSIPKKQVEDLLERLAMEYLERSTALEIAKIADKYILQLKPEFTSHVKSFASGGLIREAVMRTLTIVAAKQPMLQSDLAKIRSSAGEHLKELLDMGLIKKTPKGRSSELTTTDKFADMFGFSRDVAKMKEQIKIYLTAATKDEE